MKWQCAIGDFKEVQRAVGGANRGDAGEMQAREHRGALGREVHHDVSCSVFPNPVLLCAE